MAPATRPFLFRLAAQRWLWCLGVVIWGVVLFTLSARSTLPPGPQIPYQDKVLHFIYFSSGAFCFILALYHRQYPQRPFCLWWLIGTLFGLVVGALDEYHQTFTPGRSGNDLGDLLADMSGAGTGALIGWLLLAWFRRRYAAKTA